MLGSAATLGAVASGRRSVVAWGASMGLLWLMWGLVWMSDWMSDWMLALMSEVLLELMLDGVLERSSAVNLVAGSDVRMEIRLVISWVAATAKKVEAERVTVSARSTEAERAAQWAVAGAQPLALKWEAAFELASDYASVRASGGVWAAV